MSRWEPLSSATAASGFAASPNSRASFHERHITGTDRASARHPAFRSANTMLANIKNSLLATHRAVGAKHLPRYLGAFAWRINRRFVLSTIHQRLAVAAATTPPMPYRLLKLAEARW
jgi:ISXO2-like transposase domain